MGIYYAQMKKEGFTSRELISPNGHHPQMTTLKNGITILAWDEMNRKDWQDPSPESSIFVQIRMNHDSLFDGIIDHRNTDLNFPVLIPLDQDNFLMGWNVMGEKVQEIWYARVFIGAIKRKNRGSETEFTAIQQPSDLIPICKNKEESN